MAASVSLKSQPLHNFNLPQLKWATHHTAAHRFRKCTESTWKPPPHDSWWTTSVSNATNNGFSAASSSPPSHLLTGKPEEKKAMVSDNPVENSEKKSMVLEVLVQDLEKNSTSSSDGSSRPKILLRFRKKNKSNDDTGDRNASAVNVESSSTGDRNPRAVNAESSTSESEHWNLRSRKVPSGNNGGTPEIIGASPHQIISNKSHHEAQPIQAQQLSLSVSAKEKKKRKLSIALTNSEIEDDILAMTGKKPTRRPKNKRPKVVQKQVDFVFPGLCLDFKSITANSYGVPDNPAKI